MNVLLWICERGQWARPRLGDREAKATLEQAVACARAITAPLGRAEAIADVLAVTPRLLRKSLASEALGAINEVNSENCAPYTPAQMKARALAAIAISSPESLRPSIAEAARRALTVFEVQSSAAQALARLPSVFRGKDKRSLIELTILAASDGRTEVIHAVSLAAVLEHVGPVHRRRLLPLIDTCLSRIDSPTDRADVLCWLSHIVLAPRVPMESIK